MNVIDTPWRREAHNVRPGQTITLPTGTEQMTVLRVAVRKQGGVPRVTLYGTKGEKWGPMSPHSAVWIVSDR